MKKLFLFVIALMAINASIIFAEYASDGIYDVILDDNLVTAASTGLGATFGSDTFRGAVGINYGDLANLYFSDSTGTRVFPGHSFFLGGAYRSEMFGISLGYEVGGADNDDAINENWIFHAPAVGFTALNDSIRLNLPFYIGMHLDEDDDPTISVGATSPTPLEDVIMLSMPIQFRYYPDNDIFTQFRLFVNYGMVAGKEIGGDRNFDMSSVGFEARFYFGIPSPTEGLDLSASVRVGYDTSLGGNLGDIEWFGSSTDIIATDPDSFLSVTSAAGVENVYEGFVRLVPIAFSAGNDVVSVYIQPDVAYEFNNRANVSDPDSLGGDTIHHAVTAGIYTELYIYPIPELEIYLESGGGIGFGEYQLEGLISATWWY